MLVGAESEAKRLLEEARAKADSILNAAKGKTASEREDRLRAARDQAKAIVESARSAAEAEAQQIASLGAQERAQIEKRFRESAPQVIKALAQEIAEAYVRKGSGEA